MYRFATVANGIVIRVLGLARPGAFVARFLVNQHTVPGVTVVCLDEAEDDLIQVGDGVIVDEDGVARRTSDDPQECDVCHRHRVDVKLLGRDAAGDPDAPLVCAACREG